MGRYFISYSAHDDVFASRVYEALMGHPDVRPWMEGRDDPQGLESASRIIRQCEGLLLVLSSGAMSDRCLQHLKHAWNLGKPRIGLRVDHAVQEPRQLEGWPVVDFTGDLTAGLRELWSQLGAQRTDRGCRQLLVEELADAERGLRYASTAQEQRRYSQRKRELEQRLGRSPSPAAPAQPPPRGHNTSWRDTALGDATHSLPATARRIRFINEPPQVPSDPLQFKDREVETDLLDGYLRNSHVRVIAVTGEAGCGKTAMVARYLGQLRAGARATPVDAVLYLGAHGARQVNPASLLDGLSRLAGVERSRYDELLLSNRDARRKLEDLLPDLGAVRACIVIDNLEELLDRERQQFADQVFDDLVTGLLSDDAHGIKLVVLSRTWFERMLEGVLEPSRVQRLPLSYGLEPEDVKQVLQRLDDPPTLGLADIQGETLERLQKLTGGHPRAIEAIFAILRDDLRVSLPDLLGQIAASRSEAVVDFLVGEMLDRLYPTDRHILQALAIYERPVSPEAIDDLLRPYAFLDGPSEPLLQQLLSLRLVRQDGSRYYLPEPDRELVLSRIPEGRWEERDREPPPFTKLALLHRAADYCLARSSTVQVKRIEDLDPHFDEIYLRIRAKEFVTAFARVEHIQDSFLSGWGHAGMAAEPRRSLVDHLDDDEREMVNLTALADVERDAGEADAAVLHYKRAMNLAKRLTSPRDIAGLHIKLGGVFYRLHRLSDAIEAYDLALSMAEEHVSLPEHANALAGLAICHAGAGEFREAFERADEALQKARSEGLAQLEARVFLYTGIWYGQLGETLRALELLDDGRDLAAHCRPQQPDVEGMCLSETAEVLIDQGRASSAVKVAEEAIAIGERIRNTQLVQEASTMLALALLCNGGAGALPRVKAILDDIFVRRRAHQALNAVVMRGIVALRLDDPGVAQISFRVARADASALWNLENQKFSALDTEGLAQCGLALCANGEREALDRATRAFDKARALTTAPGVIVRVMRLLDELEAVGPPGILERPRRAAWGRTTPSNV
jgi:tetratricopeptide (TPR) repeat protein